MTRIERFPGFLSPATQWALLQWARDGALFTPGRQGTGYEIAAVPPDVFTGLQEKSLRALGIDKSVGYDCYVMRYTTGSFIPKHKDTAFFGSRHLRINAIIQDADEGGFLFIEGLNHVVGVGDAYVFRPDLLEHEVTEIIKGERYVWTLGTMLPQEDTSMTDNKINLDDYKIENLHKLDLNAHFAKINANRAAGTCALCGSTKMADEDFKDAVSRREARITATCQKCQDEVFAEPEEEEEEP